MRCVKENLMMPRSHPSFSSVHKNLTKYQKKKEESLLRLSALGQIRLTFVD